MKTAEERKLEMLVEQLVREQKDYWYRLIDDVKETWFVEFTEEVGDSKEEWKAYVGGVESVSADDDKEDDDWMKRAFAIYLRRQTLSDLASVIIECKDYVGMEECRRLVSPITEAVIYRMMSSND